MKKCPKCGSEKIRTKYYSGSRFAFCLDCGYDESSEVDVCPEENKSQKAKGKYTVYKSRV